MKKNLRYNESIWANFFTRRSISTIDPRGGRYMDEWLKYSNLYLLSPSILLFDLSYSSLLMKYVEPILPLHSYFRFNINFNY